MPVPFWLLLFPAVISAKLSTRENQMLKEECGDRFLQMSSSASRFDQELTSIGERVERNEYPFVAALYIEEKRKIGHRTFALRSSDPFCSGVLISRRHVMTAAHCFMENKSLGPENVVITAGSKCADPGQCVNDNKLKSYEIDKIIIHPNYTSNPISKDVAIVALGEDVSTGEAKPICMPTQQQKISVPLVAAGFGLNENMDFPGLQMVKYSKYREEPGYIETMSGSQSVCRGDSGGPLFQSNDEQKLVLMGITSAVRPDCTTNSSRVCPVNAEVEQQTTTSPPPESSTATSNGIGLLVSVLVLLNETVDKSFAVT
ncbi:trypsin [Ancylostoma caninum]|uniref:Trypsin n=1 Tax=Ancylostoma caninum TaxID=29170 RepID=A0A368FPT5_ANCCA|nr:trypsin [Ancylostoma caninum]